MGKDQTIAFANPMRYFTLVGRHSNAVDDQSLTLEADSAPGTLRPWYQYLVNIASSGVFDRWKILNAASGER
jgi:hypothetical protein